MRFALACLAMLSFASAARADLVCTLSSGEEKTSVYLDLSDVKAATEGLQSDNVFDLAFYLEVPCQGDACDASITITSSILEDEAGQTGFSFNKSTDKGVVFTDKLTGAPDKKKYSISCTNQ